MKSSTFCNDLLKLIFQATAIANIADNAGTSPLTSLYLALHSADPGAGGNQNTNEATYTGYARVAVARTSSGFTVSGSSANLASLESFGACTGSGQTLPYWSVGTASSGAGKILYSGPVGVNKGVFTAMASSDIFTTPAYTPTNGDQVSFEVAIGATLPNGITAGTVYFVVSASGTTFKVSATNGGAAIDLTTDGEGLVFLCTPFVVTSSPSVTPQLTTATTITES